MRQSIDDYLKWLKVECGYVTVQRLPDEVHWVGIRRKMFTWSIEKGRTFNLHGTEDCWCYHSFAEAVTYLLRWLGEGGKGEPQGWHRHPGTGRRVAGPEGAYDDDGKRVEPGQAYVCR